jgi:hypothetical protein
MIRFEERRLQPYAEPVTADGLEEGRVYFMMNYIDEALLIPTLQPLVFVGFDLAPGDSGRVYFQDLDSHQRGVRFELEAEAESAEFITGSADEIGHLFEFEQALEELLRCAVRRRGMSQDRDR